MATPARPTSAEPIRPQTPRSRTKREQPAVHGLQPDLVARQVRDRSNDSIRLLAALLPSIERLEPPQECRGKDAIESGASVIRDLSGDDPRQVAPDLRDVDVQNQTQRKVHEQQAALAQRAEREAGFVSAFGIGEGRVRPVERVAALDELVAGVPSDELLFELGDAVDGGFGFGGGRDGRGGGWVEDLVELGEQGAEAETEVREVFFYVLGTGFRGEPLWVAEIGVYATDDGEDDLETRVSLPSCWEECEGSQSRGGIRLGSPRREPA